MKLSFYQRMVLLGILPSIATVFFLSMVISGKIGEKVGANKVEKLCRYIVVASGVVHELQKERGASAVYISSSGKEMKNELESLKKTTDEALLKYKQYMESFALKKYSAELNTAISSATEQLNSLTTKRNDIASLSLQKSESTKYYSTLIDYFIQSFENVVLQTNHPLIFAPVSAYVNFISAKELSGIERARISGIVSANEPIEINELNNWITVWRGQEKLLENFEYLAPGEVLAFYKTNHAGAIVDKFYNIRNTLLAKAKEGNFGITGKDAFDTATQRINVLKSIEDYQSDAIQNLSKKISSKARNGIILFSIIGAGALGLVFSLIFISASKITNLFRSLIEELTGSATQLASASEEISASSQSLSEATTQQAASIEETSSTMEEMSSMTKQNADNAKEAASLAKQCNNSVEKGNYAVVGTVENGNSAVIEMAGAMHEISESSGKIAAIIKIIEGIAFQTNLLALNAAVEAARAGEHGRGFAVVAEEVRNLAQKSSTAAKDITTLITDSVKKAETGKELVDKTKGVLSSAVEKVKEVFSGVTEQVQKMVHLVNEISTASDEQANGIDQIGKTVQQMDQVTQQNAATAEETAAASEELTAQAQALNDLVEKIGREVNVETEKTTTEEERTIATPLPGKRQVMSVARIATTAKKIPAYKGNGN